MTRAKWLRTGAAGLAALALIAPGVGEAQRIAGTRPDLTTDEGGLWTESDKAERAARQSAELNADQALAAYVRQVSCKVATEYCDDIRIYVLDRPYFNAAAAPNGYVEVWSGLLLRVENEAELAFVLGHEISHFGQDHSIKAWRAAKTRQNVANVVSAAIGIAGAAAGAGAATQQTANTISNVSGVLMNVVYLGALTSFFSFSREQEAEADALAFQRASKAGYAPGAGAALWQARMDESASSDFERVRRSETRVGVFASHPLSRERMEVLEKSAAGAPAGDLGAERLRTAIRPHLGRWLKDDLRRQDFGQTLFTIGRLSRTGQDLGVLGFYQGETYRLRRADGDLAKAQQAYLSAAAYPDAPVDVWRELGEARRKNGDMAGARVAFETYLAKAPEAEDAWLVNDTLKSLNKASSS